MNRSPYTIIDRPIITERATQLSENDANPQYVFRVQRDANKVQIRQAIEAIFNVKVSAVNTVRCKGKLKRQGRFVGHKPDWKKAFVTLEKGQKLEVL
jgi:large subunit ribosomal protein L23